MTARRKRPLDRNPLLDANPSTLPPYRKGTSSRPGGLVKYVYAVNPGPPPFGWRDITPYFGETLPESVGYVNASIHPHGFHACVQIVSQGGLRYRRIAVARIPSVSVKRSKKGPQQ